MVHTSEGGRGGPGWLLPARHCYWFYFLELWGSLLRGEGAEGREVLGVDGGGERGGHLDGCVCVRGGVVVEVVYRRRARLCGGVVCGRCVG